jgi:hypothetical protein
MIHQEQGKKWELPNHVRITGALSYICKCHDYRVIGFRPPRKGEFYLSGALVSALKAPSDLDDPYLVVELLGELGPRTVWIPKEA